jgi:hypothetical protein
MQIIVFKIAWARDNHMRLSLIALLLWLLVIAGCSAEQRADLHETLVAAQPGNAPVGQIAELATPSPSGAATATPAGSVVVLPTAVSGPLATLTAIAPLVATPVDNATPYAIVNQGKPHFLEFHAWW